MTPASIAPATSKFHILLIMGSVRTNRLCPLLAGWVEQIARASPRLEIEIIDLAHWSLPMTGEPDIPASGLYHLPSTRAWSEKIAGADAVIFLTPQYNWGYPAALKNAIDHLHAEWRDKPAVILTYGGHGGGKCAVQLRQVLDGLKVRTMPTMPAITLPRAVIEGMPLDLTKDIQPQAEPVEQALRELESHLIETPSPPS